MASSGRLLAAALCLGLSGLLVPGAEREPYQAEGTGVSPLPLSLGDAVRLSLDNNLDGKLAAYVPRLREEEVRFQQSAFDPNVGFSAFKADISDPTQNVFDIGTSGEVRTVDSTVNVWTAGFSDPLIWGGRYSADLSLSRLTSTSANAVFPTTYESAFVLSYDQSLLRSFGRKANSTPIVIARTNQEIGRSQLRDAVLLVLQETENAYWDLVFARQDLAVSRESLGLAQQLLEMNRVKVEAGALPLIEITQAEAEVADREQGVIVAENAVRDAEDVLRRVMNLPRGDDAWSRPIEPTDEPEYRERSISLEEEIREATANRPDLEQARLEIANSDARLAFGRNQLKWDLTLRATYTLQGLSGDAGDRDVAIGFFDCGLDQICGNGDPGDGNGFFDSRELPSVDPNDPSVVLGATGEEAIATTPVAGVNQDLADALEVLRNRDAESWSALLALNIPIGNNAAQATYVTSRLAREQSEVAYQNLLLRAEVEVRTAVRAVQTSKRRIDAAERNVDLQRQKVEAEQTRFENGMSTSFQVLEYQEDLTTALGTRNQALVDYRKALSALEKAKGTLDAYLNVSIE